MKRDPICNMHVDEQTALTTECDGETFYFCSEGCRERFHTERTCTTPRRSYDLIIIGGGPAGLTAAVYAATLNIEAFLISRDLGGQAIDSTKIENYMGYDFITGPELVGKFRTQLLHSHYVDHLISDVEKIEPAGDGYFVTTSDLTKYFAKALIVTTGMRRRKLRTEGEERFQRRGILYGNIQDFSFVQGKDAAVIGGGNSALQMVENLHTVARTIHLVSATELTGDTTIIERVRRLGMVRVYEHFKVLEFSGDVSLSGVTIRRVAGEETLRLPVEGAFIAIGLRPNASLLAGFVERNDRGEIIIRPDCSTSRPGIFAAGDVTNAFGKRIIIAAGEGAKAALAARQYLLDLRKKKEGAAALSA